MKGGIAVFLACVIAGVALYYQSDEVAKNAALNGEFMSLYGAARAAHEHRGLYASEEAPSGAAVAEQKAGDRKEVSPDAEVAPDEAGSTDSALAEKKAASTDSVLTAGAAFSYPPYFALVMLPLSFIDALETAALTWYWTNVALFIVAMFFAVYTLAGTFATGERALFLVPLVIAVPLIAWYLPVQSTAVLALTLVLAGLCLFRAKLDIPSGIVSSLALFSPLGVVFVIYYLAKRAWLAVAGILIGAIVWFAVIPAIYFGPQTALEESQNYVGAVLLPLPARMMSEEVLASGDNYSLWAMLARNTEGIKNLGAEAVKYGEAYKVNMPEGDWRPIVSVSLGVIMLVLTLLGIWRKPNDRDLTIYGLEGAQLILAVLLLSPYTPLGAYILAVVGLFAAVYVIRSTDVRKFVHHVNYVGLILAGQLFCLAYFSESARLAGAAFGGVFVLWVAVLAGVSQFRPHIVRGRRSILAEGPRRRDEKPIELARVSARGDEKEEKKEKDVKEGKAKKGGIMAMPSFAWRKEKIEGAAGVETEPKAADATPVELAGEHKDDKGSAGGSVPIELLPHGESEEEKGKSKKIKFD